MMSLKNPSAPFEPVFVHGESITLDTSGKVLVLPSGNPDVLPLFNEYSLNSNRLTVEESPFGGLKSGSPDYAVGTLYTPTDGVYLTDVNGENSTKTLTAGMLKGVSGLTVDTVNHTITQDFQIVNTSTENEGSVPIDAGNSVAGWTIENGTGALDVSGGVRFVGVGVGNAIVLKKSIGTQLVNKNYIVFTVISSVSTTLRLSLSSTGALNWTARNFQLTENIPTTFVLPVTKSIGSVGTLPASDSGYVIGGSTLIYIGTSLPDNTNTYTFTVNSITADTGKSAYIELHTPDNLSPSSLTTQCWTGTSYETVRTDSLDGVYSNVSIDTTKAKFLDGTLLDHVYGTGLGRAVFPKGVSGAAVTGSTGTMTYSANQGTSKRIGLMVSLPPSDGGRTDFNKIRLRTILRYTDTVGNIVPDLSGNGNTGTIVGGVTKLNVCGLKFDGSTGYINCGNTSAFDVGTGEFSIVAKLSTTSSTAQTIVSKHDFQSPYHGFYFAILNPTTLRCQGVDANGATFNLDATVSLCDGNIHRVAAVFSDTELKLYADGAQVGTALNVSGVASLSDSTNFQVGGRDGANTLYNGSIYEVVFYKRALSQNDAISSTINVSNLGSAVCYYSPTVSNMGSTTHQFADSTNASYGLQNMAYPWLALYDPASTVIDFYLPTHRFKNLEFKRDESGTIYELSLYPGNGQIYHGQIDYADLTADTDSNDIPDCLEASLEGSLTKFLKSYGMITT